MSNKIFASLVVGVIAFSSGQSGQAQEKRKDPDANHISIGIGVVDQHSPFNAAPTQTSPLPFISIRQGAYYFDGAETGLHFDHDLGGLTPSVDLFAAARSPRGQDREKLSVDAGARIALETGLGKLSGEFRHDISDTFDGSEFIARYSRPFSTGRFTITPAVQANWLDRKAANYMYGVTAAQRARMIRKQRSVILPVAPIVDDALNLGGDVTVAVRITDRLMLIAVVGGTWLDKSIARSAAIDQEWEAQSAMGLTYSF